MDVTDGARRVPRHARHETRRGPRRTARHARGGPRTGAPRVALLLPVVLATSAVLGWSATAGTGAPDAAAPTTPAGTAAGERAPAPARLPAQEPACTPAPLRDRAAAVLVVGLPHVTDADQPLAVEVAELGVGGVFLSSANVEDADQVADLVQGLRARSPRPLLVTTDEESGRVSSFRDVLGSSPSPRRLAERLTPEEVREHAAEVGDGLAAAGVDVALAPLLDLEDGPWDGVIGDRAFSADPEVAGDYGLAFASGLVDAGVLPTVKHFPGHGRSTTDTHVTSEVVGTGVPELRRTDLAPFQRAIDAGAPLVMLNHLAYDAFDPDLPASLSPGAYDLLRDMGFEGVAITDSVGMGAVHTRWDFPDSAVLALAAGADAVLATDGSQAVRMRDAIVDAVRTGELDEDRLTLAAARVTALAGGDPVAMGCADVRLPRFTAHVADEGGAGEG